MARPADKPAKQTIIDALVLACSHSQIRDVVGTDALRSVLDFQYRDITADGRLNLQVVWELFESQPGFEPELAAPPMCRFKSWEKRLGMGVDLPLALRNLTPAEQADRSAACDVPTHELHKLMRAESIDGHAAAARQRPRTTLQPTPVVAAPVSSRQRLTIFLVIGVALISFGFGGYSLYRYLNVSAAWKPVTATSFAGSLPVARAERFTDQVRATLTDPGWPGKDRSARESELEQALDRLAPGGVTVLYVRDASGDIRAVAQRYGSPARTRFSFR